MAGTRTGTPSIWRESVRITRLVQKFGASDMAAKLGTPYADCVNALVTCVIAVLASDDFVLQVDYTTPGGPEDISLP
jgi:hypothetical protein